jgi:hypothetical protein
MYMRLSHVHVTKISPPTPDGRAGGGGGSPPLKKSGPANFFLSNETHRGTGHEKVRWGVKTILAVLGFFFRVQYPALSDPRHERCVLVMGLRGFIRVPEHNRPDRAVAFLDPEPCQELLVIIRNFR